MTTGSRARSGRVIFAATVSAAIAASVASPVAAVSSERPAPGAKYVALGSSYAAGGGLAPADPTDPGGVCGRSLSAYPALVAQALDLNLVNSSCGGATIDNVTSVPQQVVTQTGVHAIPPQMQALDEETELVTVTVGGNDVGYVTSLMAQSCLGDLATNPESEFGNALKSYGICNVPAEEHVRAALAGLEQEFVEMVQAIKTRAPRARVLVVDYLTVLPANGATCDVLPIPKDRQKFLIEVARDMGLATRHAAQRTGVELVAMSQNSRKHDVCSREPWVTGYDPSRAFNMMHPNEAGQAAVAAAVVRQLSIAATR